MEEPKMDAAGPSEVGSMQRVLEAKLETVMDIAPFNMSPLHVATAKGEVEVVKLIMNKGDPVELSSRDDLHRTPLHLAAYNDHAEVVKMILSKLEEGHVDVNAPAMFGITPLHLSIMRRSLSVAEVLISTQLVDKMAQTEELLSVLHMAADVGQDNIITLLAQTLAESEVGKLMSAGMVDRIQRTPLHYAARAGHLDVVRLFLQQPFYEYLDVNAKDADGLTPLHLAARVGHTGVVAELLKCANLSVNAKARNQNTQASVVAPTDLELEYLPRPSLADSRVETSNGFTALHLAAREGHKGVVTRLLRCASILVNEEDADGLTPLHYACMSGQAEVVKILLENSKRNVNAEAKDKSTPLHLGVKNGHIPTVIELLRQRDINCNCEDGTGSTVLDIAEREGHINLVWLLLEHPVEVRKDPGAEHLYSKQLELAAKERHEDIVRLLFQRISDEVAFPDGAQYQYGQHLLHWAADMGYKQLTRLLLEWGSPHDVNVRDSLSNTPLHYAAQKGHIDIVRMLLGHSDVDINAENIRKETPLHLAAREGQYQVVKELSLETTGRLRATEEDKYDRTALQLAVENRHKDIQKLLLERPDVQEYVNGLYRDRQVYVDAANAILVGSSLIASVTFAAWLQPPLGYAQYVGGVPGAAQPSGNYEVYADLQQHPSLEVFWIFNTLSFFFSIATVMAGAGGVLPMRERFIKDAVQKVRRALLWTALLLAGSVIFVLGAFATAGYVVLPPIPKYRNDMIITIVLGGSVCAVALGVFLLNLYQLLPEWWRSNVDHRCVLKWRELWIRNSDTKSKRR
ncbi:hypothetical protein KC19_6G074200 [Ceratodon purpureus]|uniref:PGG domain-containing protein n=1 Tax=Ceratodon purpureus TaxID=3225 RepID=A0A8T0HEY5_CERPU|nr:hypothetical protein KC19_6G074200 [Ceratodon purpureus]